MFDEAAKNPEALPLLEFTLDELYKQRSDNSLITWAAYDKLGGLKGAIAKRADEIFAKLSKPAQRAVDGMLSGLIQLSENGAAVLRRASRADLPSHSAAKEILDAYITAKLFVSDRDQVGEPTVALAHAALLTAWPRVQRCVHGNPEFLREKARIREARRQYLQENKSYSYLLPRGKQLKAGRELLKKRRHDLSPEEISFIRRSSRRARVRAGVLSVGLVSAVALSLILLGVLAVAALLSSNGVNPHEYYVLVTQQCAKGHIQRRSGNKTVALREYQKGLDGSLSLNVPVALRFFDMEAFYRMLELITDTGAADPADATLEKIYGLASDIAKSQEQNLLESDHVVVELSETIGRFLFERGRWQKSAKYYDRRLTWLRERTKRNPSDKANQEKFFTPLSELATQRGVHRVGR